MSDKLPGKVAPADIDFVLERGGRFLSIEMKPENGRTGIGQSRTIRALRESGWEVWIMYGDGPLVSVDYGDGLKVTATLDAVADEVVLWWDEAGKS